MSIAMPKDEGPLPEYQRQALLQRLSIQALVAALPADMFLLRQEPGEDAGVDWELETLYKAHFNNCRAKVQLKATDSEKSNQDGSISLAIATSNLRYLLNN